MTTYTADGEVENDLVLFQFKATDRLTKTSVGSAVATRIERRDLDRWLGETFPVILVVYDAQMDCGYWLYFQEHFGRQKNRPARDVEFVTIHIPIANVLEEDSIRHFAAAKAAVRAQTKGVRHHE
jgi:hypothetical protein